MTDNVLSGTIHLCSLADVNLYALMMMLMTKYFKLNVKKNFQIALGTVESVHELFQTFRPATV